MLALLVDFWALLSALDGAHKLAIFEHFVVAPAKRVKRLLFAAFLSIAYALFSVAKSLKKSEKVREIGEQREKLKALLICSISAQYLLHTFRLNLEIVRNTQRETLKMS